MTSRSQLPGRAKLAKNVFANWTGLLAEVSVALFLTPFIITTLGTVTYGVWSLANGVIGYLGLIDLGLRACLGRFVNQHLARGDDQAVNEVLATSFAFLAGAAVIVGFVAFFIGVKFSAFFEKTPADLAIQMRIVLPLLAVGLLFAFVSAICRNIVAAFDRFDTLNIIGVLGLIVRAGLVVLALELGGGLVGLVAAAVVSGAVVCVATYIAARRIYPSFSFARKYARMERLREMWRFGAVAFVTRSASEIIYRSDQVILMAFVGPRAVAVYGVAMMLVLYAQRVVEQLAAVLDPSVMKSGGIGDVPSLQQAFSWYPRAAFFVAIPLYGGLFVFGTSFIRLWVGPDFDESTTVLRILSIAELLSIAASMGGSVLFSLGRLRFNLLCSISEASINLGLSLILVGVLALGTTGAAVGTLVAVIVCRAIVHPLYTTAALGMKYSNYLKESIARGLYVAIVTLLLFTGLVLGLRPSTWVSLIIAVALSGVAYLTFGAFGIFGLRDTGRLINGILPAKWRIYQ